MKDHEILDNFETGDVYEPFESSDVVAKYYSSMEAEVAAARLRSEGIPCFLANHFSQSVLAATSMSMVRLHVRPEDKELALEILIAETPPQELPSEKGGVAKGLAIIFGIVLLVTILRYVILQQ
jgi:hypothetical protein